MQLVVDSRERSPLEFPKTANVELVVDALPVGDYGARHGEVRDPSVIERKSVSDLFTSFAGGYEAEKAKLLKAKALGFTYILAIEAPFLEVLKGHSYWHGGTVYESRKTGLAQLRQLATWERKYDVRVWYCHSRREMALRILEYFLAQARLQAVHPCSVVRETDIGKG